MASSLRKMVNVLLFFNRRSSPQAHGATLISAEQHMTPGMPGQRKYRRSPNKICYNYFCCKKMISRPLVSTLVQHFLQSCGQQIPHKYVSIRRTGCHINVRGTYHCTTEVGRSSVLFGAKKMELKMGKLTPSFTCKCALCHSFVNQLGLMFRLEPNKVRIDSLIRSMNYLVNVYQLPEVMFRDVTLAPIFKIFTGESPNLVSQNRIFLSKCELIWFERK